MTSKPWADSVPAGDVASFGSAFGAESRPLSAGTRPALIIVDMTYMFVDSNYPSGWSDTGQPAVTANARLLAEARRNHVPVFFSKKYADPEHEWRASPAEKGRWKRQASEEDSRGGTSPSDLPPGDVIVKELEPLVGEAVIHKGSKPSAFFGTPLVSWLIHEGVDTVIVTGMTTSGCVRATALDAFMYNFSVIVPYECSADRSQISHKISLFDMHMKYADVVSVDETVKYLEDLKSD